ncbi:MAG: GNAT family N-acetyltransferase [Candidatus Woesearchaeota archaeon]
MRNDEHEITIRRAKLKDSMDIARLSLQFWEAHPPRDPMLELKRKPTLKKEAEQAEKDIRKKNTIILAAEKEGKIIGCSELLIKKNEGIFRVEKYGYINTMVVDRKHRKKGIAKKLADEALKFFRSKGIKYVRTNVYLSNRQAEKFWLGTGFRPESQFMLKKI